MKEFHQHCDSDFLCASPQHLCFQHFPLRSAKISGKRSLPGEAVDLKVHSWRHKAVSHRMLLNSFKDAPGDVLKALGFSAVRFRV